MNFIEQIFGIFPDHGSGTTEAAVVIAAVLIVAGFWAKRRTARSKIPSAQS